MTWGCAAAAQEAAKPIRLPAPRTGGEISVEQALGRRQSVREFAPGPLALRDVAQVLWAAQGLTQEGGRRTAPSAGALYPLEVYLVAGKIGDLQPGVYRYRPKEHVLVRTEPGDARPALAEAALGQRWVREAPAVIVIAGVYARTAGKYGERAPRYVHIEVGHAAQNVYLQATALGLGTVMVGAFRDDRVQAALGLPADHAPLALLPLGKGR